MTIDAERLAALVAETHSYTLPPLGAARAAAMVAAIERALSALAPEPQLHEEPARLALTLSSLAPEEP